MTVVASYRRMAKMRILKLMGMWFDRGMNCDLKDKKADNRQFCSLDSTKSSTSCFVGAKADSRSKLDSGEISG